MYLEAIGHSEFSRKYCSNIRYGIFSNVFRLWSTKAFNNNMDICSSKNCSHDFVLQNKLKNQVQEAYYWAIGFCWIPLVDLGLSSFRPRIIFESGRCQCGDITYIDKNKVISAIIVTAKLSKNNRFNESDNIVYCKKILI